MFSPNPMVSFTRNQNVSLPLTFDRTHTHTIQTHTRTAVAVESVLAAETTGQTLFSVGVLYAISLPFLLCGLLVVASKRQKQHDSDCISLKSDVLAVGTQAVTCMQTGSVGHRTPSPA